MATGNTFKFEKVIDISLPEEEIEDLVHIDVLSHDEGSDDASGLAETYATNASLNRAVYWITTTDCANITAWRSGNKRAINDANNTRPTAYGTTTPSVAKTPPIGNP